MVIEQAFIGMGTLINVATVVVGSLIGLALGNRLSERTRDTITDGLGLVTLVVGGLNAASITSKALSDAVGRAGLIVVLLAILIGGLLGSWLRIEARLNALGERLREKLGRGRHHTFAEGFVTATLVYCIGPLAILGSISDGLGRGADQLIVKAVLDGFASIAFASALGIGVMLSAGAVLIYQGLLTVLGAALGTVLPAAEIDAITVTGGVMLLGVALRLLNLKQVRVGDLTPALVVAPLLVALVVSFR